MAGYEKNRDFRPTSRFISEMTQDTAVVTVEPNRNFYAIEGTQEAHSNLHR